jgi:hypothetical protein
MRRKRNLNSGSRSKPPEESLLTQLGVPLRDFVKDFKTHGANALQQVREKNPEKYLELAAKLAGLVATLKPEAHPLAKARDREELAAELLKTVNVAEDQITPLMIEQAMAANDQFLARLEQIRDAAQGILEH